MDLSFNPHDWYWIVGGSGPHLPDGAEGYPPHTQVFSSARNRLVPLDDAAYVFWREPRVEWIGGGEPSTRIANYGELAEVLRGHGVTFTEPAGQSIVPPPEGEVA